MQEEKNENKIENSSKPKCYVLDMFPYPSGDGLHVGHPKGYVATDIYSRYKKMNGFDVIHPMGWDAFGLPAEQYAIKNKIHPRVAVEKNIANFKSQLEKINFDYDWDRELSTTDPKFYKWTQWIFKQLYKKGLAYESFEPINWCPSCKTGLANEDLEGNACERCGTAVEKKPLRQWNLAITKYADRLIDDLELLKDWPEHVKTAQKNWIGRSEGAEIEFKIVGGDKNISFNEHNNSGLVGYGTNIEMSTTYSFEKSLKIFTTRADTIFGCTFMAINYNVAKQWIESGWVASDEVKNFINKLEQEDKNKSIDFDIAKLEKEGVDTGVKAINPANEKEIPIYIANYVLSDYGTGAVMAVPAHDERDYEFAKKYSIEILDVIERPADSSLDKIYTGYGKVYNSISWVDGLLSEDAAREIVEHVGGKMVKKYKLKEWVFARQRYWGEPFPVVYATNQNGERDHNAAPIMVADSELPVPLPEVESYEPTGTGESPLAGIKSFTDVYGYINEEGEFESVQPAPQDKEFIDNVEMPSFINKIGDSKPVEGAKEIFRKNILCVVKNINNNKYLVLDWKVNDWRSFIGGGVEEGEDWIGAAIREIKEEGGYDNANFKKEIGEYSSYFHNKNKNINYKTHTKCLYFEVDNKNKIKIDESEILKHEILELEENKIKNFFKQKSAGGDISYLLYHWDKFLVDENKKETKLFKRETNTMPQWAGSSWYWLRFLDPHNDNFIIDPSIEKAWPQVDVYVGGDHATRHLIYARFWHKFLYDIGIVSNVEPFKRLEFLGFILAEDGSKMSKSKGNTINPNDIVDEYGSDAFRVYEMFMAPFEATAVWSTSSIKGVKRFLERVEKLKEKVEIKKLENTLEAENKNNSEYSDSIILNQTIKKVGEDIENFKFNTAISQMMICLNEFESLESDNKNLSLEDYKKFLTILAPFAPTLFEKLEKELDLKSEWPKYDQSKLQADTVKIALQINGKLRDTFDIALNSDDEAVISLAKNLEAYKKYVVDTEGKSVEPKKIIVVKNKIVNVVV